MWEKVMCNNSHLIYFYIKMSFKTVCCDIWVEELKMMSFIDETGWMLKQGSSFSNKILI